MSDSRNASPSSSPDPRERVTGRALTVWIGAVLVYIVAITGRTSFGVAGVDAIERFDVDASRIAVFTAVQVGVYAFAQIPTGMLIDRFGPRRMLVIGALIMATGQILLGLTTSYGVAIGARVLIGAGDATAFLSVMRILPFWFPLRRTPIFTQLTTALGQMGQFLSAVPFLALLNVSGWTVAFISLGATGAIIAVAAGIAVADAPPSVVERREATEPAVQIRISTTTRLKLVLRSWVCWQGFFIHWIGMLSQIVFCLLWGVPLMTLGMGLGAAEVGLVLTLNTVFVVITGPIIGLISARIGARRGWLAVVLTAIQTAAWVVFFVPETPRGLLAVVILNIIVGSTTAASNYGFDTVRERLDRTILATGTGLANMGGFFAGMITAQVLGLLLDHFADGSAYTWHDFRLAWISVFVAWVIGAAGFVIAWFGGRGEQSRMTAQIKGN